MNIFVGNLSREVTAEQLREAFEPFGAVSKTSVVRGFGFVDMPNMQEALAAIQGMNRQELAGQAVDVTQAHTREDRSGGYYRSSGYYRSGGAYRSGDANRNGGTRGRNGKRSTRRTR